MLGFRGPAQPSSTLGDALNAGYLSLEVRCSRLRLAPDRCARCGPQAKSTPIHELERYMRCKECSQVPGYAYKRSHLVALRQRKISAI
jgi:predicted Zn-ribbon and HTH transcriptional regulator